MAPSFFILPTPQHTKPPPSVAHENTPSPFCRSTPGRERHIQWK